MELNREEFLQWVNAHRSHYLGRCYLPDQHPLELFVRDIYRDEINFTASVHPIHIVGATLFLYAKIGLVKMKLPRWAVQFKVRTEQMIPHTRGGVAATLSHRQCMEALGEKQTKPSFGRKRTQVPAKPGKTSICA